MIGKTGFVSGVEGDGEGIWCEATDAFASLSDLRAAHESFFKDWMED